MDKLLQPDVGLMITTVITFVLLLVVLSKAAWKPILEAVNKRESKIRGDLDNAQKLQADAESLRQKYEAQLNEAQRTIQEMLSQAKSQADRTRTELVSAAKEESERILEKGRKDLSGEIEKLRQELRTEVADLSVTVAEKILGQAVDKKMQENILQDALKGISNGASK